MISVAPAQHWAGFFLPGVTGWGWMAAGHRLGRDGCGSPVGRGWLRAAV